MMLSGKQIAAARKEKGLTQAALAERLGVSAEVVSKWEKGVYEPKGDNAALLLHDVAEDCGVGVEDLPVRAEVREIVALVTKPRGGFSEREYYRDIEGNTRACLVKCIDRCNNLSTMSEAFSPERMVDYIEETERYFPRLLRTVKECPAYNNAAWLLNYQIKSLLQTAKRSL